jgi:two-component system, NarL family, sensor histidine kinase UhpB
VERERGRLAADLHADVLPALRRALSSAEDGGSVERLAVDLRDAVDEVEALLSQRRSIVLEEMGLLAAVEWLAERVEERSDVRVVIDVGGASAASPSGSRPPRSVERAAFRIAQLALDNVERHAPGSTVEVTLVVAPEQVHLTLVDNGPGLTSTPEAAATEGRRGLSDMRSEAVACGGRVRVGRANPPGTGTSITFDWPAG